MKDIRFETGSPETGRPETGSAMRVLIAEDDALAADILEMTARKAGIAVEMVRNGLDAADRVAAAPAGYYGVVLLDIRMPIMDGREAARRIRDLPNALGTVPIFAMSASEAELLRHPWATWLFDGHLTKPLQHGDFLALLRERRGVGGIRNPELPERDHRNAIVERIEKGEREIGVAVARSDFTEAGEAARRMRLGLLGLAPEDLIRALHVFQLSQAHGRKESAPLMELKISISAAKRTLAAA